MTREPVITERPQSLPSATPRIRTGCGSLFCTISQDPECFEFKMELGKSGSCQKAFIEALSTLLTIMRRQLTPIPRKMIVHALEGIRCPQDSGFIPSCPEAIARVLKDEWGLKDEETKTETPQEPHT